MRKWLVFGLMSLISCGVETETTSSGVVIGNLEIGAVVSAANAGPQVARTEAAIVAQTAVGRTKESPTIFLANERGEVAEVFDCREKVYVYVSGFSPGNHLIEGFWYNPAGKQQEYTRYEFSFRGQPVWLWLKLHPSTGGRLFGGIDPGAGMGEFIGKWKVTIYLDGKFLKTLFFYVTC